VWPDWIPFTLDELSWEVDLLAGPALIAGAVTFAMNAREARRGQAAQVSAWMEPDFRDSLGGPVRLDSSTVHIVNGSGQPIYRVLVWLLRVPADPLGLAVLPGGMTHDEDTTREAVADEDIYSGDLLLVFSDGRGRRWQRDCRSGRIRRARWYRRRWVWRRQPWRLYGVEPWTVVRALRHAPPPVSDEG
jgi:hypothetical protein